MGKSNALADDILTYYFTTGTQMTRPTAWYVRLHTGDPGADGTSSEVSTATDDANYAAQSATFSAPASHQTSNSAAITFPTPATGASYTVSYFSVFTAATGGTCLCTGQLANAKTLTPSNTCAFAIGELVLK